MKLTKLKGWGRVLLPAFLLIILIQGVLSLPEVQHRFFPEKVWPDKLLIVVKGCAHLRKNISDLEGEFLLLNYPAVPVLFSDVNYFDYRWILNLPRWVTNNLHLTFVSTTKDSFEGHYYLARKNFFHAEEKLKFLELRLNYLFVTSQFLNGSQNSNNQTRSQMQNQMAELQDQFEKYHHKLNIFRRKLQKMGKTLDMQACPADKRLSTRRNNY